MFHYYHVGTLCIYMRVWIRDIIYSGMNKRSKDEFREKDAIQQENPDGVEKMGWKKERREQMLINAWALTTSGVFGLLLPASSRNTAGAALSLRTEVRQQQQHVVVQTGWWARRKCVFGFGLCNTVVLIQVRIWYIFKILKSLITGWFDTGVITATETERWKLSGWLGSVCNSYTGCNAFILSLCFCATLLYLIIILAVTICIWPNLHTYWFWTVFRQCEGKRPYVQNLVYWHF